jgi:hypothetical protein
MHINTVGRALEVVTISDVQDNDAIHVTLRYVGKDGVEFQQLVVFDNATYRRPGWTQGPGWFLLNSFESNSTIVHELQVEARVFYRGLPWRKRLGGDRHKASQWVQDHVQFAIRPIGYEHNLYDKYRSTRGQIIKNWWLEVIPLVDGVVAYDATMDSGSFRARWLVSEVTVGKVMRANAMS